MKLKMMVTAVAMLCVTLSFAQQRQQRSPEEIAKNRVEQLDKSLSLSKVQKDSIYNVVLSAVKARQAERSVDMVSSNREVAMKKMKEEMEKQNAKIKTFLTKEQVEKYDETMKNFGKDRGQYRLKN